ncbi:ABC transporter permease [Lactobacillus sp. PV034]|uniref:ABC transporter permease n=1 Tax=Lactobacillus sp. PV034 TaxID=2594495 RepID=UPI002240E19C|nr:ABC transporter permease [Lactobacillus sp. PV034]QNQ81386.1 lantibiotic ABC transporter permease [Lactobacillus sp. PV034]
MLKKIVGAEIMKMRRSFLLFLHLIILILFPLAVGMYYGNRKDSITSASMVIIFFEILSISSPILISIVVSSVFDREEKAGKFKNWLTEPVKKGIVVQDQLYYYWGLYGVEIIGTSLIYYLVLRLNSVNNVSFLKLIGVSIVFALCGLAQYELAQCAALKWNIGGTLTIGFFGTVISLLSITSLFDIVWPIIPWAWQMRLITFWQPGISWDLIKLVMIEYLIPLIFTILIILFSKWYFNRWEGK